MGVHETGNLLITKTQSFGQNFRLQNGQRLFNKYTQDRRIQSKVF